jgi:hypothetical protein
MTKEEIEKVVGKKLDKGEFSLTKSIYNGILYFFKREIEHDHYFYVPAEDKLYMMPHNKENYDDEITLTGKFPDSFQFNFEGAIADGRVIEVTGTRSEPTHKIFVSDTIQQVENKVLGKVSPKSSEDWDIEDWKRFALGGSKILTSDNKKILEKIDKIIIELTDLKTELRK